MYIQNTFWKKNWAKRTIQALSSGQSNLQTHIWGCHRQLDDHYRNPNMNNKDHLVGQLTTQAVAPQFEICLLSVKVCLWVASVHITLNVHRIELNWRIGVDEPENQGMDEWKVGPRTVGPPGPNCPPQKMDCCALDSNTWAPGPDCPGQGCIFFPKIEFFIKRYFGVLSFL